MKRRLNLRTDLRKLVPRFWSKSVTWVRQDACLEARGQHETASAAFFRDAAVKWGWLWQPNLIRLKRLTAQVFSSPVSAQGTGLPNRHL